MSPNIKAAHSFVNVCQSNMKNQTSQIDSNEYVYRAFEPRSLLFILFEKQKKTESIFNYRSSSLRAEVPYRAHRLETGGSVCTASFRLIFEVSPKCRLLWNSSLISGREQASCFLPPNCIAIVSLTVLLNVKSD